MTVQQWHVLSMAVVADMEEVVDCVVVKFSETYSIRKVRGVEEKKNIELKFIEILKLKSL